MDRDTHNLNSRLISLQQGREKLSQLLQDLRAQEKSAFMAAPPMPQGGAPPAQGGMPMDPAAMGGMPMDPAAMGGMPMDPAAMGGMPPGQGGGMPMDPAAMQAEGGAPPEMLEEVVAIIEQVVAENQAQTQAIQELGARVEELQEVVEAAQQAQAGMAP